MARYILYFLVLFLSVYFGSRLVPSSAAEHVGSSQVRHGKHPKRIVQIATLPDHFKLSETSKRSGRRLIFIGDVHGAYDELVALLEEIEYNSKKGCRRNKCSTWLMCRPCCVSRGFGFKGPSVSESRQTCYENKCVLCYWKS